MSRPTKSAAESAEKPAIIFGRTRPRKQGPGRIRLRPAGGIQNLAFRPVRLIHPSLPIPEPAARLVLDTNVVLDWLVFGHPCGEAIERRLRAGSACWVASPELHGELLHVLGRGVLARWQPDLARIESAWRRHAVSLHPPQPPAVQRLRCTDADDQKFVDFALAHRATLLSRDRAVLKLARRARGLGFAILTPERWLDAGGA